MIRALRYNGHQIPDQTDLLIEAAGDQHGRVRMEAIVAASWLSQEQGLAVLREAGKMPLDDWILPTYRAAEAHLNGVNLEKKAAAIITELKGRDLELFTQGKEIYQREGYCGTCHQSDGRGLEASQFPPLAGTSWVLGSQERLIKLTLNGLMGPIEIGGKEYPGQVPMTPFAGLLNDEELAAVLTYVRNSFGNEASVISPEEVREVRATTEDKKGFYNPAELLAEHPELSLNNEQ